MAGSFDNVISKFQWAYRQIVLLDLAIADYVAQKPYVTAIKDETGAQSYRVTAHLRYPPPASIAHIVSDALNSLQGSLDYLARELALRENEVPDIISNFPIIKTPKQGTPESRVNVFRREDTGSGEVPMIKDQRVLDILRKAQPYHLPKAEQSLHCLQILRTLNGQSKHRHPAVLVSAIAHGSYGYVTSGVPFGVAEGAVAHVTLNVAPIKDSQDMAFIPYSMVPESGLPEYDDFMIRIGLEGVDSPLTVTELLVSILQFIDTEILTPIGGPIFGVIPHWVHPSPTGA